jgi:molybdate transport system substrate-binding protein
VIRSILGAALLLAACSSPAGGRHSITVFAAASLTDAFQALGAAYTESSGVTVVLSFDASSALRAQIQEGAPADVFASADLANADALVDAGLTHGESQVFAGNTLAVVVPRENRAGVDSWQALASPNLRILAAGPGVPITRYADELVDNLARREDAPAGFARAYADNVVSREDNVRAVLSKVELGEGDAAIVYETDAASSDAISELSLPEETEVVAEYAVVDLSGADAAGDFMRWLLDDQARSILAGFGFRPPPPG